MYFTISDYDKFTSEIIDGQIKKELFNKFDISRVIDGKIETLATKAK